MTDTTKTRRQVGTVLSLVVAVLVGAVGASVFGGSSADQACLSALDEADDLLILTSAVFSETVPLATESAYYGDIAGMEEAGRQLERATAVVESSRYKEYADECRG